MRPGHVAALAGMLLRYFTRRILAVGVLRRRRARAVLGTLLTLNVVVLSSVAYLFLDRMFSGRRELRLLLEIASVSTVFWTLVLFVFVKILFLKSDGLLACTLHLPVTHRERAAALTAYESVMIVGGTSALFVPLGVSVLLIGGPSYVALLAADLVLPCLVTYLVLAIAYNLVTSLLERLRVGRLAYVLVFVLLGVTMLAYNGATPTLVRALSTAYLEDRRQLAWVNAFGFVLATRGVVAMAASFLLVAGALFAVLILSSPARYPEVRAYLRVPLPTRHLRGWPVLAALVRRAEWWIVVALTYTFALLLFAHGGRSFVYTPALLVSQGIYAYAATARVRSLPGYRRSSLAQVSQLLACQALMFVVFAAPLLAVLLPLRPEAAPAAGLFALACLSGILITTLVGILLAPEHDNPLVAFVSYGVCLVVVLAVAVTLGVLQLPRPALWSLVVGGHLLAFHYSIVGVDLVTRRKKHA